MLRWRPRSAPSGSARKRDRSDYSDYSAVFVPAPVCDAFPVSVSYLDAGTTRSIDWYAERHRVEVSSAASDATQG